MSQLTAKSHHPQSRPDLIDVAPAAFGKVAVIFGGRSAERAISLKSGRAVLDALLNRHVDAHALDPDENFAEALKLGNFDRAFIVLHGPEGEDGVIQGCLQMMGIPFTGSGVAGSALAMDKIRAKLVMDGLNIPTPPFGLAYDFKHACELAEQLGFPVAVKPVYEGSSIGVTKATQPADMQSAYDEAKKYGDVMVEKWIEGRDLSLSVVGDAAFPPVEARAKTGFFNFVAKYESKETQFLCPAPLTDAQTREISVLGYQAFCALGCEDWGRVDLVLDQDGKFWVLEVNTIPGMTPMSQLPRATAAGGMDFEQTVYQILGLTLGKTMHISTRQESKTA